MLYSHLMRDTCATNVRYCCAQPFLTGKTYFYFLTEFCILLKYFCLNLVIGNEYILSESKSSINV